MTTKTIKGGINQVKKTNANKYFAELLALCVECAAPYSLNLVDLGDAGKEDFLSHAAQALETQPEQLTEKRIMIQFILD
ncbi:MAG: hypothetical protein AABX70_07750 [Nanoarchaeota archaeon]